jgi:ZIP family zinc transporter
MQLVLLTAIGVGGSTVLGALIGLLFKNISHRFSDIIVSFAAGIMLAAAVLGLIVPAMEYGGEWGVLIAVLGILVGALCIKLSDKLVPHIYKLVCSEKTNSTSARGVLLFVVAIGIHNIPEGIAAGVGFGSGDVSGALLIAWGIALHNIPEGMVIIAPMLSAGISVKKTFICAMITGMAEVIGTLIGYFAVTVATAILPFALAFAGGTMLYVISEEMIPETHNGKDTYYATYAFLCGFCTMLVLDAVM